MTVVAVAVAAGTYFGLETFFPRSAEGEHAGANADQSEKILSGSLGEAPSAAGGESAHAAAETGSRWMPTMAGEKAEQQPATTNKGATESAPQEVAQSRGSYWLPPFVEDAAEPGDKQKQAQPAEAPEPAAEPAPAETSSPEPTTVAANDAGDAGESGAMNGSDDSATTPETTDDGTTEESPSETATGMSDDASGASADDAMAGSADQSAPMETADASSDTAVSDDAMAGGEAEGTSANSMSDDADTTAARSEPETEPTTEPAAEAAPTPAPATAPSKPAPPAPKPVKLTQWWGAAQDGSLSVVYAGSAAFQRAVVLMFDGAFDDTASIADHVKVTDPAGKAVSGQWQIGANNKRMLILPVDAKGIYTVSVADGLTDRNGRSTSKRVKGPVRVQ